MRIAVIGTGISGLACAWLLNQRHTVTVYESEARLGGHSNTVMMPWRGGTVPVDTGFLVYNEHNYPHLTQMLAHLGVPSKASDMTFGVSVDGGRFEYAGGTLTMFAQPSNLARPRFHGMLRDILRFNRDARRFLAESGGREPSLGVFLEDRGYGEWFRRRYLLPMSAAIWSASLDGMLDFPARSLLQFFDNHGLLSYNDRPQWRTIVGGSKTYVEKLAAPLQGRVKLSTPAVAVRRISGGVEVIDGRGGRTIFDHVVLACHGDQALRLIERPDPIERTLLGAFRYQANHVVLHRDPNLMPKRRAVWSSWNYLATSDEEAKVSVTYWLNRLQGIDPECLALVSLNPIREPDPASVVARFDYDHPQHDMGSIAAQRRLAEIQGVHRLWFAGAHWANGFHEDGLRSGLAVAAGLGVAPPWEPGLARPWQGSPQTLPETAAAGAAL
ncbi:MAG: FAD-dependent oxidoreductase [Pseudomonadota bacterium]